MAECNATSDCTETLRELDSFLDSELSDQAHHAIRGHLDGCTDCLETFDFYAELKTVVAKKCNSDEMPPDLMSKIAKCFDLEGLAPGSEPGLAGS